MEGEAQAASVDYAAMDAKLEPVVRFLRTHQYQLALDRLKQLDAQGIFLPTERWRVDQRYADCYFGLLNIERVEQHYWTAIQETEGMPYQKQCEFYSNDLFTLHYLPHASRALLRERHLLYDELCKGFETFTHDPQNAARRHAKIRIGYIAPTFCETILSFFCTELWRRYDREQFEVYLYALNDDREDLAAREVATWVTKCRTFDRRTLSRTVAQAIYDDGVDILFDVNVHADGGRTLQVLKYRPAPIQMAGIGYMSTSGLGTMDYFLTDVHLDPPDAGDDDFSEALVRLPHSHFCYTPPERVLYCKNTYRPKAANEGILFASFNNFAKLNDPILLLWKRILDRVPDAKLLLKNGTYRRWFTRHVKDRARALGLPMDRLIFEEADHYYFDRYQDVDILLDTYPYVGGGTTCDALLAGVPVITRYSDRHGTRFGLSLLANLGLEALAADTDDAYVEKAVALAGDHELLAALHAKIPQLMKTSPVMDGDGYVRAIEAAYRTMWQDYLAHGVRTRAEGKRRIFI